MKYHNFARILSTSVGSLTLLGMCALPSQARLDPSYSQVKEYGTEDQIGTGPYAVDPKIGASLWGLSPGTITQGAQSAGHTQFVPDPSPSGFAGTDTIHVGSGFTNLAHDGYSYQFLSTGKGVKGPDIFALDYSSLIPDGQSVQTLTLGIAADDFQAPKYGQLFTATINGTLSPGLSAKLNDLTLTDPSDLFFTFGVDPTLLTSDNILKLSIDEGGDGGDGYAVDFLTIGVTSAAASPTTSVPEATSAVSLSLMLLLGLGGILIARRRKGGRE